MIIYRYDRHHAPYEDAYKTMGEAIERAYNDHESGEAYFKEIIDGDRIYSHDEIMRLIQERYMDE